ncbi:Six-hairpin glycosidase-like protein [Xylariaceae sp. FL0594]|nr:Six-hairpin glycosidase-like protein [Xylariaceae sp. FL0594]
MPSLSKLATLFICGLLIEPGVSVDIPAPNSASKPLRIWSTKAGSAYNEYYMIGNGRLGASVPGTAQAEVIHVNEDSLWSGGALSRVNPDALAHMPEMQSLITAGNPVGANTLAGFAYAGTPVSTRHYDVLGDLTLTMNHSSSVTGYERWLDLADATSGVYYSVAGTTYTREYLASSPSDVIAIRLAASRAGALSFYIHLRKGSSLNRYEDYSEKVGSDTIVMGGGSASDSAHTIGFASGARVTSADGTVKTLGDYIICDGATEAWIYFTTWTTVRKSDPRAAVLADLQAVPKQSYAAIRHAHVKDHQGLMSRVDLNVGSSSAAQKALTTENRMARLASQFDPELVTLNFQFGRYLLIASSRNNTLPPNLQGIWNKDIDPQWGSKYTININLQMNYWPSYVTNLVDLNGPLFDLIDKMLASGTETAKKMYNARGAVAHHNTDLWGDTAPQDNYMSSTWWPLGLAWTVTHVWDYYEFTGDAEVLRRHYPALRAAALFLVDFMTDYKGWKVTNPSISPENAYYLPGSSSQTAAITAGPTMDNSIAWYLFGIVLDAQRILGIDDDAELSKETLTKTRAQLPPLRTNSNGGIMEWIEDYRETEPGHRHWSPLFGLYPGNQITSATNATTFAAAKKTISRRLGNGGGDTGWSRAWAIALAARTFDADTAARSVTYLLSNLTHPASLLDANPPSDFQVDGNFGATAGIAETVLQSHEYVVASSSSSSGKITPAQVGDEGAKAPLIRLLPALPAQWGAGGGGYAKGLLARGGFQVDVFWDGQARLVNATITSLLKGNGGAWVTLGSVPIGGNGTTPIQVVGGDQGQFVFLKGGEKGTQYRVVPKR